MAKDNNLYRRHDDRTPDRGLYLVLAFLLISLGSYFVQATF
jgi:hypothetical protein